MAVDNALRSPLTEDSEERAACATEPGHQIMHLTRFHGRSGSNPPLTNRTHKTASLSKFNWRIDVPRHASSSDLSRGFAEKTRPAAIQLAFAANPHDIVRSLPSRSRRGRRQPHAAEFLQAILRLLPAMIAVHPGLGAYRSRPRERLGLPALGIQPAVVAFSKKPDRRHHGRRSVR